MTEEQKAARKKSAENGHIKWIKDNCLRTKDDNEDFVFISYKSDNYEKVLDEIVYNTCRKYGLKVYFDTAFDDNSDSWINQFYENMKSIHCKAFIAFIDNNYYLSYATLLEMMASRTAAAGGDYKYNSLFFLPINLETLTEPKDEVLKQNTGLGTARFADETENKHAEKEVSLFNEVYSELVDENRKLKHMYKRYSEDKIRLYCEKTYSGKPAYEKEYLNKALCRAIMDTVMPECNDNDGTNKEFVEVIHDKLSEYGSVFIKDWKAPDENVVKPNTSGNNENGLQKPSIENPSTEGWNEKSLDVFVKNFNDKNFNAKEYAKIKITGKGEAKKFFTDEIYKNPASMVRDFADRLANILGKDCVKFFESFAGKAASPIFISKAEWDIRKKENKSDSYSVVKDTNYCINTHMSPCRWITYVLKEIVLALGLELQDIVVSFTNQNTSDDSSETVTGNEDTKSGKSGGTEKVSNGEDSFEDDYEIDGPVSLYGTKTTKKVNGNYNFCLYGKKYEDKSLKELMVTVFTEVLGRHTDKIDAVIEAMPSYIGRGNKIDKTLTISFRAGKVVSIDGNEISIATAINQQNVLNNIKKLMKITEEDRSVLVVEGYEY